MGEVTVTVAGRPYQVICEDGEEDRLRTIAARVDAEAQVFNGAAPSLSESRLLLMSALLLADKLDEAERQVAQASSHSAPTPTPQVPADMSAEAAVIEEAASRIAALAGDDAPASEAGPDDAEPVDAASNDDGETTTEEIADDDSGDEDAPATARRNKSSAAMAAERDLLSWLDRPDASPQRAAADEPPQATEDDAETPEEDALSDEVAAPDEPATDAAPAAAAQDDADEEARERAERRRRRRERLARLSERDDD